jgi:hypothetical protein
MTCPRTAEKIQLDGSAASQSWAPPCARSPAESLARQNKYGGVDRYTAPGAWVHYIYIPSVSNFIGLSLLGDVARSDVIVYDLSTLKYLASTV